MPWVDAHEAYVRSWLRADPESVDAWDRYRTTGYGDTRIVKAMVPAANVAARDERAAYWSTFLYQRLHADVMIAALRDSGFKGRPRGPILVVDIGCGAGTVGVALGERLQELKTPDPVLYLGWDHNQTMRSLATAMLTNSGLLPAGSLVKALRTLKETVAYAAALAAKAAVVMTTFSYFFRQGPVGEPVARAVASDLAPLIGAATPVRVLVTDAVGKEWSDTYPAFVDAAKAHYQVEDRKTRALSYVLRYPYLYPDEGAFKVVTPSDPTALYRLLWLSQRPQ